MQSLHGILGMIPPPLYFRTVLFASRTFMGSVLGIAKSFVFHSSKSITSNVQEVTLCSLELYTMVSNLSTQLLSPWIR